MAPASVWLRIGVLAVLAAVMGLHTEMNRWEKTIWVVLIGAFFVLEIQAIKKDRKDFARAEACRRQEELQQFQNIADTVTGGTALCYVTATFTGNYFLMIVNTQGVTPLHEVTVEMRDLDVLRTLMATHKSFTWDSIKSITTRYPTIPFLVSSSGYP